MKTHAKIEQNIKDVIPSELWIKYSHLSFAEMANEPELDEWKNELLQAEADWWDVYNESH